MLLSIIFLINEMRSNVSSDCRVFCLLTLTNFQHLLKFAEKSHNFRIVRHLAGFIKGRATKTIFFFEGGSMQFVKNIWNHELLVKFMNISCLSTWTFTNFTWQHCCQYSPVLAQYRCTGKWNLYTSNDWFKYTVLLCNVNMLGFSILIGTINGNKAIFAMICQSWDYSFECCAQISTLDIGHKIYQRSCLMSETGEK